MDLIKNKVESKVAGRAITSHARDYSAMFEPQAHFLNMSYSELEEKNLELKKKRINGVTSDEMRDEMMSYLESEKGIKAVSVCFSDLEGKLHVLDYDKKFIIGAHDNLTFDGSSIKGFTPQDQSDLRLKVDWASFRFLPADVFGAGKTLVFGFVCNDDGSFYQSDFRSLLSSLCSDLFEKGVTVNVAPEVEGFLLDGEHAEQYYEEKSGFELATMSGYFNSLPQDTLRLFMDKIAEVQRALAFENEKDHPEVAPAQFEVNFRYSVALDTADQIQLYKLVARQVAKSMGLTACFLPKPIAGMNGSGMHTNMSLSKDGSNIFYDANGKEKLSGTARNFVTGILAHAKGLCLLLNSSVNAYRRLDPHFEAPNEIKVSSIDRGSMVRIPIGNEKSARIEVRTVAPDANPYLSIFALVKAGLHGINASDEELKKMEDEVFGGEIEKLPGEIYEAIEHFDSSEFVKNLMGAENHRKYSELKTDVAGRSPRSLGNKVKNGEILYHHEVSNQLIWSQF
jgi:glutamine synthetase